LGGDKEEQKMSGILSDVFGAGGVAGAFKGIIDKFVPDANLKLQIQQEMDSVGSQLEQKAMDAATAQTSVNLEDAKSLDKYKSYARPTFLYLGLVIMALNYVLLPFVNYGLGIFHQPHVVMPDSSDVNYLVYGLLGIYGTQRTAEKIKGKA
jgi:Holin of 3TMs, for gene-transfer release